MRKEFCTFAVTVVVTIASASTLPGSVVRTFRGGEGLPKMYCLAASSPGRFRSQCSIVCGSSLQRGHKGSAEGSRRLAVEASALDSTRWSLRAPTPSRVQSRGHSVGGKYLTEGVEFGTPLQLVFHCLRLLHAQRARTVSGWV